jgi:EamA domain-containing membrane protein RarD
MAALLGLFAILLSGSFSLYALYGKVVLNKNPVGFTSIMLFISFLTGVQLFFLGVIGEYVGRIYQESKRRPLYVLGSVTRATPRQQPSGEHGNSW